MSGGTLRLAGGHVVLGDGSVQPLDVVIDGDRIADLVPAGQRTVTTETIDVTGKLVAPGFIDLQINGGWGDDFTRDPGTIGRVADRLPSTGVTAFLPTIVTAAPEARQAALEAIARVAPARGAAAALGLHLEGPCISPSRAGAHDPAWIAVPADELAGWSRETGVALVTLAPELDGAPQLIEQLVAAGVVVAAGHSDCTAADYDAACRSGLTMVTHLFNAMRPFTHRDPGLAAAALAGDTFAGLICDGIHVDPVAVRVAWRALGPQRTVLVTDAVAALGGDGGGSTLAGVEVSVDETGVRTAAGVLAGSTLTLDRAVRNLRAFTGCTPAQAIATVTANPAAVLGLADRGRVEPGALADLTVLDGDLHVESTFVRGELAWKS